jgi:sulfate adenylyltransferase subunit 1
MDLLRINTAGSVDDGKSTLIGRLLYDTSSLTIEQEELIARKTAEKGMQDLDFSVITDGLIAEREQGITIDVAHIYYSSDARKFIIADSPGHVEYTRNMVTGASNSEVSIILIDARKGLLEQSYRHFFISRLLRVPTVIFCINKMDLVGYNEDVFLEIATQIERMAAAGAHWKPAIELVPISGLKGDNVVQPSAQMPWYQGPTLDQLLHQVQPADRAGEAFRMEVQQVLHVQNEQFVDFRGYAGRIGSGKIALGDTVVVLPGGRKAEVLEIRKYDRLLDVAAAGDSIVLRLTVDVDASRGTLLAKEAEMPSDEKTLVATLVWLDEKPANAGARYILQAGARSVQAKLETIHGIILPSESEVMQPATVISLNDCVKVGLRLSQAAYLDPYAANKANGAFILVDPQSNHTAAVGFVE